MKLGAFSPQITQIAHRGSGKIAAGLLAVTIAASRGVASDAKIISALEDVRASLREPFTGEGPLTTFYDVLDEPGRLSLFAHPHL